MKAVLVLDEIPNSCEECPLRYWGIGGWSCISTRRLLEGPIAEREEWCPLRPLPQKMKTPITEAIPVEWMEVWLAEHEAWDFHTTFIDMINDWRNRETE